MRPGQNKRMRGGRSNNRKAPNPLTRSYESNGPDVKIRGTAHHVGEKYLQLARDAQSSGDPVMAESYLQHAEHYFRLIAAAQQAQQQAAFGYQRQPGEAETDEDDDDDDFGGLPDRFASPPERFAPAAATQQPYAQQPPTNEAQPYQERPYYNNNGNGSSHNNGRQNYERPERQDRAPRQDRNFQGQDRNQDRNQDRGFQGQDRNQERTYQDRNQERSYQDRQPYQERQGQNRDQDSRGNGSRGRREYREPRPMVPDNEAGLPAFITAPVRLQPEVHMEGAGDEGLPRTMMQPEVEREADSFLLRPRRRRRKAEGPSEDFRGEATNASDPVGE
ncbi:DUF4167 domain-containing protein [Methyloferula stellata]|jgi:hypothetical protein|uniref:DUF4167 domain-containing protein n=1 Tax=Methyloferula stellata TaxID=876270 RepID=UPI00047B1244|nr:DUF4167 domain-containing protein [Methyloferula stellata]